MHKMGSKKPASFYQIHSHQNVFQDYTNPLEFFRLQEKAHSKQLDYWGKTVGQIRCHQQATRYTHTDTHM